MNQPDKEREKQLLHALRDGSEPAFDELYNDYKFRLAANLYKMLKSWEEVEEILQELFVKVWENRSQIDPEKVFSAYLYRIAVNLVYDYFRRISKDKSLLEQVWTNMLTAESSENLKTQILQDEELMRTIDNLPPQRQKIFKLCKLEGKTYKEVASLLNVSEAAVNDHITKANRFIVQNYDRSIAHFALIFCSILLESMPK